MQPRVPDLRFPYILYGSYSDPTPPMCAILIEFNDLTAFLGHINSVPEPADEADDEIIEPSWKEQTDVRLTQAEQDIKDLKAQVAHLQNLITQAPVAHGQAM